MIKKQQNRKDKSQNKRNKLANRYYLSTIRLLTKCLKKEKIIIKRKFLQSRLNSMLDKAIKKNVLHPNTVAKKKSITSRNSNKRTQKTKLNL